MDKWDKHPVIGDNSCLTFRNLRQFIQENGMDMASTVTEVESLVFLHASQAKKTENFMFILHYS